MYIRKPLQYQTSGSDCVPTSIINALVWMFQYVRPEIIRTVWQFCLDGDGTDGTGFARQEAMMTYLNLISESPIDFEDFGVKTDTIQGTPEAIAKKITACLNDHGVVLNSVWYGNEGHMSVLLGQDDEYYYCFDPLWRNTQWQDPALEWSPDGFYSDSIPADVAQRANTKVKKTRLLSRRKALYSVGDDSFITVRYSEAFLKALSKLAKETEEE